jgi:stage IV sporulation protein FB
MRDPFSWSLPLGRVFGIVVRIHILFFVFVIAMWLKTASKWGNEPAMWMLALMGLLFVSVLLHELGHCFAARHVDGEANEVLLWPLGGLAKIESLPHSPWAHFVATAGGPLVNVLLCVLSGAVLVAFHFQPSFNPLPDQCWNTLLYNFKDGKTWGSQWAGVQPDLLLPTWTYLVAQFFWVNWVLLLFNTVLIGFPMDSGRLVQAILWPRLGYRAAMRTAIFLGYVVTFIVIIYALVKEEVMLLFLAWFMYQACKQEWVILEMGGEESLFGYDFSQGYTSLERDQPLPAPRRKRPNVLQRWLQRRAAKKQQRAQEQQEADERRMDELLQKIARSGKQSLTDEEQRFLKRVSDRYRNRH